jgi:predicted RNA-binding Zn-ribbon protein involved in translation (DUF1610 family)
MTDEEAQNEERQSDSDAKTSAQEYAGDKKCPECGEPVIDVRATCPNCGYEYKEDDFSDKDAGQEFVAGSAVDDEGNEIPDHETGGGADEDSDDASEDSGLDGDDGKDES